MKRLLLIEDEDVIRRALSRLLARRGYDVVAVGDIDSAIEEQPTSFDIVLVDLRLPGRDGTTIIPLADPVPVIVMTSHASVRSAVDAMRAGASDYIAKPFDHDELLLVLERALGRNLLGARNHALQQDLHRSQPALERVKGTSLDALTVELLQALDAASDDIATVNLHGAPGSGREDIARVLHARSSRADTPLLIVDACDHDGTALTLLGQPHESGGLVRAVRGGMLVLRNPELLSMSLQAQITARLAIDKLRLVTITRQPKDVLLATGALDPQFATIMGHITCAIPSLSKRRQDIVPLSRRVAAATGLRHTGHIATLSEAAMAALVARDWPGNLVELEACVGAAIVRRVAHGQPDPANQRPDRLVGIMLDVADVGRLPDETTELHLDLDGYFRFVVAHLQDRLSETELAARLGISRKALWERRQRMALPRKATEPGGKAERDS